MRNDSDAASAKFDEMMRKLTTIGSDVELRDNESMETPINRAELDAKLETIEAKIDARIVRLEVVAESIRAESVETRKDIKSMKTTVITTAVVAALTIVFGVAGFNAMLTSNMFTAFQAGQQTAQHR